MNPSDHDLRAVLFHGLSERSRIDILAALAGGPRRVSDIVLATGLTQPNASKQLACLHDCGLVERERLGRETHYRLAAGLDDLLHAADAVLALNGERVAACPRYGCTTRTRAA